MNCPGCSAETPFLFPTRLGHRCTKCRAGIPPLGRPRGSTTVYHDTAADPPVFVRRQRRTIERIPVIKKIEERLQGQINWIKARDPELRALKHHAQVEAYEKALQIVRHP